eukprot:COSAG01_NODE_3434_length_6100_cov_7.180970_4_plen_70_part_00
MSPRQVRTATCTALGAGHPDVIADIVGDGETVLAKLDASDYKECIEVRAWVERVGSHHHMRGGGVRNPS